MRKIIFITFFQIIYGGIQKQNKQLEKHKIKQKDAKINGKFIFSIIDKNPNPIEDDMTLF